MPRVHPALVAAVAMLSSALGASAQCESVGFTSAAGSPANQGFTAVGTPIIEVLSDGQMIWTVPPGAVGLFAPPTPPWPGPVGTRQLVRCTMRVISSPSVLSPTGVHDAGFAIYRGTCVQGGNVVAGVTNDGIFISISTPGGVETEYEFAPFSTTAGPAVYHFEATDHGQTLTAVSATQTASAHRPRGRYSDAPSTWRVGGGGAAPAQVVISDWTVARGLAPTIVSASGPRTLCPGGSALASISVAASEDTQFQWQIEDASAPTGWRNLTDGPLFVAGALWGEVSGARTPACLFLHGLGQSGPTLRTRAVALHGCGSAVSTPASLRLLPDFNRSGAVDTADLVVLLGGFGAQFAPFCCGDIDGDGRISTADLVRFLGDFGAACP